MITSQSNRRRGLGLAPFLFVASLVTSGCGSDSQGNTPPSAQPDAAGGLDASDVRETSPESGEASTVPPDASNAPVDVRAEHNQPDTTPDSADGSDGAQPAEDAAEAGPTLPWEKCDTSSSQWPDGFPAPVTGVQCAMIDVPVDNAQPQGSTMSVRVARLKSKNYPTGKATFIIAGGPGMSSVAQSALLPPYLTSLRENFDLLFMDQRGTGGTDYLGCGPNSPQSKQDWIACAQLLSTKNLNNYLTLNATADMEAVRVALGYEKVNLWGGSYGTRLGLEYLRQHGDRVTAAVLDGLVPPPTDLFAGFIQAPDRAVQLLVDDCGTSPECLAVSPTLLADLEARRKQLAAKPRSITVCGAPFSETGDQFVYLLANFLAQARLRYRVPRAIHAAVLGDNTLWNGILKDLSGCEVSEGQGSSAQASPPSVQNLIRRQYFLGQESTAPGFYFTILCAEFLPNSGGVAALRNLAKGQTWGNDTGSYSYPAYAEACASWNVTPISAGLRTAVSSDVKTLLMSGAIDINTQLQWAEETLKTLSQGTHVVIPYATHSTTVVPCARDIMQDFIIKEGNVGQVDKSCIEQLKPPAW